MREANPYLKVLILAVVSCTWVITAGAVQIKDTESASHGYDAAYYSIVDTYEYPGFKLVQFNLPVLSHYSYMVISEGKALIVDPGRDTYTYTDLAAKENLSIAGIYLTHSHADFVAGHMELVKQFGCPIYQSSKSGAKYKYEPISEGTTIQVGRTKIVFIETPGHVVDGTSALVYGEGKNIPELILTGDFLFVGGVGRPDLVEGTTSAALAGMLFDAWHNKVSKIGDTVRVFPAHGAGSLCGAHLKDAPFSTIGEERTSNPNLQFTARSEFITSVLSELQEPPQYFKHNAVMNRTGPVVVNWKAHLPDELSADTTLMDSSKFYLVDVRDGAEYAAGHIPNSVNISLRGRFETWVGIMVPWGSNLVLTGSQDELKEANYRLNRIGYSAQIINFNSWSKARLPVNKNELIPPQQLYSQMQAGTEPIIVDVRLPNEWIGLRIGTVLNLPLNHLSELSAKLDKTQPVVTVCNSAYRSIMAIGILEKNGFKNATSLAGGSEAWIAAGLPVYGAETKTSVSAAPKKVIPLPERISATELKRLIMDLPGTFDVVDIRPAEHFKDYSIPGSTNVDIAELIGNPSYLVRAGPLIIVDRDGSLAMAVGGILSQKTQRQIKSLYGGIDTYWKEADSMAPVKTILPASPVQFRSAPPAASPPSSVPSEQKPETPKKKSAGC